MKLRSVEVQDAQAICAIYNDYVENTVITFEEALVSESMMSERIAAYTRTYPWLVVENAHGHIAGYAYASQWQSRSAYQKTVETTIYTGPSEKGQGYGRVLYTALLDALKKHGYHTAVAGIAVPNPASVAFHEAMGFSKVAHFSEVGHKFGCWVDVGYWQKVF